MSLFNGESMKNFLIVSMFMAIVLAMTGCAGTQATSVTQFLLDNKADVQTITSLTTLGAISAAPKADQIAISQSAYETASAIDNTIKTGTVDFTAVNTLI